MRDKRVVVVKWVGDCGEDIEILVRRRKTGWDTPVVVVWLEQEPE